MMMHDVILLYSKISICIRDLFLYKKSLFVSKITFYIGTGYFQSRHYVAL